MDIQVGTIFRTSARSPWTAEDGSKGVEETTVIARVVKVFPTRFEYVVDKIESCTDPLPGTDGKGWTSGGMAFFAVEKGVRPFEILGVRNPQVGDRVRAMYPNARLGEGVVVKVNAPGSRLKPLVVQLDGITERLSNFHFDQVSVVAAVVTPGVLS